MSSYLVINDVEVWRSGPAVPPVVPPVPPVVPPTPTPTTPPVAGQNVLPWEPFNTVGFFPIPAAVTSGNVGMAVRVLADGALYPNGITLNVWDQSPIGIAKEIVVSQTPNDFTVSGNNRILGTGGMNRGIYFYNAATGHTNPGASDAVVQDGQYFYINWRGFYPPRTAQVSAQFSATGR